MPVFRIARRENVAKGRRTAVMQVRRGAPDTAQRRSVEGGPHMLLGTQARADVVQSGGGCGVRVERGGMAACATHIRAVEDRTTALTRGKRTGLQLNRQNK